MRRLCTSMEIIRWIYEFPCVCISVHRHTPISFPFATKSGYKMHGNCHRSVRVCGYDARTIYLNWILNKYSRAYLMLGNAIAFARQTIFPCDRCVTYAPNENLVRAINLWQCTQKPRACCTRTTSNAYTPEREREAARRANGALLDSI